MEGDRSGASFPRYSGSEKDSLLVSDLPMEHSIQSGNGSAEQLQGRKLPQGNSKAYGAVFIVINAAMGAGLLTFPYAFYLTGGWEWGVVIQLLMLPFIIGGLMILSYCAELKQAGTYEEIMEHMFGRYMRSLTEIMVFVYCFGACITYLVVMGDQVEDITSAFTYRNETLSDYWWASRKFTVALSTVILIYPWLYLKTIGILSYTSFFGVLCCVYISLVVVAKYFYAPFECDRHLPKPFSHSWVTAFNAIPFICFAFQCHISSVPIYAGLKTRTTKNFLFIVLLGILLCTIVYTLTGVFGMITFSHPSVPLSSDILRNYCPNDIAVSIARGTLIFCLITSYPILFYCGRTALDSALLHLYSSFSKRYSKLKSPNQKRSSSPLPCSSATIRRIVLSNIWLVLSLGLALFVPQVKYIISPMGCLAGVFIFVFPGLCILKLGLAGHFRSQLVNSLLVAVSCVQIAIGAFILGDDLVYNIIEDFSGN